jgi:hypothetical protein
MTMSELIKLSENELEMVAGGQVGADVQLNINVTPQAAVALAVLTANSFVSAANDVIASQLNGLGL